MKQIRLNISNEMMITYKILNFKTNYQYKFNISFIIISCSYNFFYIKDFNKKKNTIFEILFLKINF